MVSRSLEAAVILAERGIDITVIDVRTLSPLDMDPINESVRATGRVVLVQEAPKHVGFMAEVSARLAEGDSLYYLEAPIKRLAGLDIPIPYAPQLEKSVVPQVDDIVAGVEAIIREP
jgi:pyruvate dehydrogenase E1 component beta subunit